MKTFFTTILLLFTAVIYIYAQPGTLDKSFGVGGKVLDTSIWADCQAMAVQPDGKILTGGYTDDSDDSNDGGFYIARYNKDGTIDESFGKEGKFIIRKIDGGYPVAAKSIAVQPDGKIIACGPIIPQNYYSHVGILRLNADGTIDSSFGINGFVIFKLSKWSDLIGGMVLQPDGKIVVAGNSQSNFSQPGPDFVLRYLPDGTPDDRFGEKGIVLTYYTDANVYLGAVTLQEDGKILTGGIYATSKDRYQVVRYDSDGSLDKSFGEEGFARLLPQLYDDASMSISAITVQPDDKILLGGSGGQGYRVALARFNADGSVDEGFGDKKGYTILPMDTGGGIVESVFYSATDQKIIATAHYYYDAAHQVAAIRYNYNGTVDSTFGENGIAAGGFSENKHGSDFGSGVGALQPDGKIIVSGSFEQNDGDTYSVALFRFNGGDSDKQPLIVRIKRWLQHHGISWQYNSDVRYYSVQRSMDGGITYKEVARVGNSTNSYEDALQASAAALYRLAAVAKDGTRTYSNTLLLDDAQQARIYPNPVSNNLQVQGLSQNSKTSLSIIDFNGNVRGTTTASGSTYSINTANLAAGNYLLKIQHNGTTTTQPFVKQ